MTNRRLPHIPKIPNVPIPAAALAEMRKLAKRIERDGDAAINLSDQPELSEKALAGARRRGRPRSENKKIPVTLRVDADVIRWFRTQGNGYQTRINTVLRRVMERAR